MTGHLPDRDLRAGDVPPADASWDEISAFGHRFHAYRVAGSLQRVADLTVETYDDWIAGGHAALPDDLTRLRVCLFHTVRSVGTDDVPDPDTQRWARALLEAVRRQIE